MRFFTDLVPGCLYVMLVFMPSSDFSFDPCLALCWVPVFRPCPCFQSIFCTYSALRLLFTVHMCLINFTLVQRRRHSRVWRPLPLMSVSSLCVCWGNLRRELFCRFVVGYVLNSRFARFCVVQHQHAPHSSFVYCIAYCCLLYASTSSICSACTCTTSFSHSSPDLSSGAA